MLRSERSAANDAIIALLLVLKLCWWNTRWWQLTEALESHLCRILSCVVDVLTIVPEASRDVLALNGHRAAPRCSSAFETVSRSLQSVGKYDMPLLSETTCH